MRLVLSSWPAHSLESRTLEVAQRLGVNGKNEVSAVVRELFSGDVPNPWGGILELIGNALQVRQLIGSEQVKRLKVFTTSVWTLPESTRDLATSQGATDVTSLIEKARSRADVWKLLNDQVQSGLKSRVEKTDDDRDYNDND